jgi:hypothetical protein
MENLSWVIAAIGALVGGPIMVFGVRNAGQKPTGFDRIAGALKQDWIRTGNIDFHASELESSSPQPLRLRVEEKRVIESAAGQDIVELRWRLATLAEGKELVVCWNAKQIDRISNPWETNQLDCHVGPDTAALEQATIP